ncbi:MAG TPA: SprB repeat-containing protein, partial [Chitinophagales bacterium]|nr:SprB repeat-containing protein [Chitinophagales bacterium]
RGDVCATAIDLGMLNPGGTLTHYNSTECYNNDYGDPGNDVFVSFNIAQKMGVRISLCGGATFNTTLFLLDGSCNQLYQNLDASYCPPQSVIAENLCSPGTYYVVIDGSTSAEMGVFTLTIAEDPSLTMSINITSVNVSCNGLADGFANAIVSGGTPPYQYLWTPGNATTQSISGLTVGTYTVQVTDARSCVITQSVTITQPLPLGMTTTGINPTCNGGSDGQVSVPLVSGGTLPYNYSIGGPYQPSSLFTGLPSGTYTAIVRDANGCTASMDVTLNDPPRIQGNITTTPVSCAGFNDGTITVNPTNGTPAYYCALDFPPIFTLCTGVYANLPPGPHTITIRDWNLCEVMEAVNIDIVPALTISLFSKTNVSCFGGNDGSLQVVATGGTPPILFSIDGGLTFQSNPIFTGLTANLYTVLVQDFHLCQNSLTVQIDEPSPLIASELFQFPVTCHGEADGLIVITASGGTGPYRYSMDSVNFYPSGAFDNLPGGTYHFIAVDNKNCVATLDATVHEPAVLTVNVVSSANASCLGVDDGTLTLGAAGGTPPFRYSINNGPFQTNATFTNLAPGVYVIGVEDKNDCVAFDSTAIGANVSVTAVVTKTEVLCYGGNTGSITVSGSSGTPPYSYSINNIIFQPSGNFNNLSAGNYSVIVRDLSGCRYIEPVEILEPPFLTAIVDSVVNASCAGVPDGAIYITSSGGAGTHTYNWSNSFTSEDIVNVTGGNYSLIVTDSNNCTFTLTATIGQPPPAFVDITRIDDVSCFGEADGYVDVDMAGGVPP